MVHLMGIGGREFSVGRLAGCRCSFTKLTLTALPLQIGKCKPMGNTESRRTQYIPRNPQQTGDRDHFETAYNEARLTR